MLKPIFDDKSEQIDFDMEQTPAEENDGVAETFFKMGHVFLIAAKSANFAKMHEATQYCLYASAGFYFTAGYCRLLEKLSVFKLFDNLSGKLFDKSLDILDKIFPYKEPDKINHLPAPQAGR